MTDLNFFVGYKVNKTKRDTRLTLAIWVLIIVLLGLSTYISIQYLELQGIRTEVNSLNKELMLVQADNKIQEIREKQTLSQDLSDIVSRLDKAYTLIQKNSHIDENLLAVITDALPIDVQVNKIAIEENRVYIEGSALSKSAIAEFQYNFRDSETISYIFIPTITKSDVDFTFEAELLIGGGNE